jgi:hypothetical protein
LEAEKARLIKINSIWPITSPIPSAELLQALFDVVYYTSLKTEEGKPVITRLCLVNPDKPEDSPPPGPRLSRWRLIPLSERLTLTVPALAKIAKAADPWTSALAVFFDKSGGLYIWGLIDQTVHWNRMMVREGIGYDPPGLVNVVANGVADVSVYHGASFLARLQQDTLVESQNDVFWRGPVAQRIGQWTQAFRRRVRKRVTPRVYDRQMDEDFTLTDLWTASLCRILINIQRYRHGGAILLTNTDQGLSPHYKVMYDRLPKHMEEIAVQQIRLYEAQQTISEITDDRANEALPVGTYLKERIAEAEVEDLEESLTGTVHFISSLSCIDGLVLMRPNLKVAGYGVEIRTSKEVQRVRVSQTPEIRSGRSRVVESNNYGTRHRSILRYCFAYPASLGFVVSQDGDIRALMRVRSEVVMWDNLKVQSVWFENWMSSREAAKEKRSRPSH